MRGASDRPASGGLNLSPTCIAFIMVACALTVFGILMIYSASSISSLTSEATDFNPAYYPVRQLLFAGIGLVLAVGAAAFDYHTWTESTCFYLIWSSVIVLLLAVFSGLARGEAYGAARWFVIGPLHLQPSEFAKASVLLAAARLLQRFDEGSLDFNELAGHALLLVGVPLLLIIAQPDKGTVAIIAFMVILLLIVAGMPVHHIVVMGLVGAAAVAFLAFHDEYSRARIMTVGDPWKDPLNNGYQLIQGLYAFGSGGFFGVGLGMSRQKYSYLPMAYNDFIYAVIGEELGLVGTVAVLLAFLLLVWLGIRIAREAPDLSGTLIAFGAVSLLAIQLLINVCGVLCIIPLSGKPIPFISYGGSSIMSTLLLVGLVVSVARSSEAHASVYERARRSFVVHEGASFGSGLRVYSGGAQSTPASLRAERDFSQNYGSGRVSVNANGTRRIDLGPSAGDRLRSCDGGRSGRG